MKSPERTTAVEENKRKAGFTALGLMARHGGMPIDLGAEVGADFAAYMFLVLNCMQDAGFCESQAVDAENNVPQLWIFRLTAAGKEWVASEGHHVQ